MKDRLSIAAIVLLTAAVIGFAVHKTVTAPPAPERCRKLCAPYGEWMWVEGDGCRCGSSMVPR